MEKLKELVAVNAPVLHMHHRDAFMPCSVEFFMANSELWLNDVADSDRYHVSSFSHVLYVLLSCVMDHPRFRAIFTGRENFLSD